MNMGLFFEDLQKGCPKDIHIGTVELGDYTESDKNHYGTSQLEWRPFLDKALEKARIYQDEYNNEHGHPDLTGTGLWSNFDPLKNWDEA